MNDGTDSAQRKEELVLEGFVSFALYLYTLTKEQESTCVYFLLIVCLCLTLRSLQACVSFQEHRLCTE
jgi:hypothetical protein